MPERTFKRGRTSDDGRQCEVVVSSQDGDGRVTESHHAWLPIDDVDPYLEDVNRIEESLRNG